jgi:hypothetical protein
VRILTQQYWNQFVTKNYWAKFFSLGLHVWLEWKIATKYIGANNTYWDTFFGVSFWALWKDHNNPIFLRTKFGNHLTFNVVNMAYQIEKKTNCPLTSRDENTSKCNTRWIKSHADIVKINIDGSYRNENSTCGDFIRDHHGHFVKEFFYVISK